MEEKIDKGFSVEDKRIFSKDGEVRDKSDNAVKDTLSDNNNASKSETKEPKQENTPLPEVSFSSFVLSISSSALFHFGEIPDPVSNKKQQDLPMAKQTIDILGVLKEKTAGNLTKEEDSLLENLLYDLRMRYIDEVKKEKA
jgi:PBP1b-binding outer membrane lipoprotein LpoB